MSIKAEIGMGMNISTNARAVRKIRIFVVVFICRDGSEWWRF